VICKKQNQTYTNILPSVFSRW